MVFGNFIRNTIQIVYKYFHDLNLFKLETIQLRGFDRRASAIATRIYIISLLLALIILTVFIGFDNQTHTITIRNPTRSTFIELNDRFSSTLSCPCRKITIPFGSFTSITTAYHPICKSVFVSDQWINLLFNQNISLYYLLDFRSTAMGHFQLLSSLCSLTKRFVDDTIDDFSVNTFLTQVTLSKSSLDIQIQTLDSSLKTSIVNSFRQILEMLRKATFTNQLQTGLQTSLLLAYYQYVTINALVITESSFSYGTDQTCRCGSVSTCTSSLIGFFAIFGLNTEANYVSYDGLISNVTGFVAGCYPIESLLKSTLECLFDASCLFNILEYFPHDNSTVIDPLNSSQTKFSPQSNVDLLLDSLFIEHWSLNVSFDNYYAECAPILCTFTSSERASLLYIVTQLLGFYGGLTIALRLLIPRIVLAVFNRLRPRPRQGNENQILLLERIRLRITEFNLFKTKEEQNDLYELHTSRIATRILLIFTFVCVLVLSIYTSAMIRSQTIVIQDPSETTFRDLHSKYSATLKCPCDRFAVEYGSFSNLSPRYHAVCSSEFIGSAWIDSTSPLNWMDRIFSGFDFRSTAGGFFGTLATLCNLIELTISNSWFVFGQSFLISEQLLSNVQLMVRATDALDRFKSDAVSELKRILLIIRFQTSTLLAMGTQNYCFQDHNVSNSTEPIEFSTEPLMLGDCSCALSDACSIPVGFSNLSVDDTTGIEPSPYYEIPQLYFACFVIQSVLQSSLQCFYNQTCLDTIQSEIISPKSINISVLPMENSRFEPETLIRELIDELMIEDWGESIDYSKYYNQCRPKQCSYTLNSRSSVSYIITTVIGLCGGVITALKKVVPMIVRFLRRKWRTRLDGNVAQDQSSTLIDHFCQLFRTIRVKISQLNIFETELSWNDPERQRHEIISTRIHSCLLTVSFCILIFYTAFTEKTQHVTIENPSEHIFERLRNNDAFLSTLHCPCQNISIPHQSFTAISFRLHQLCSSDFIQPDSMWTNLFYHAMVSEKHEYDDYRRFALLHLRLLSSLCQLADDIITDAVKRFHMNYLITDEAESREPLITQTNAALDQLRTSTARKFVRTLDFTRSLTQGNGIVSGIVSNWQFIAFDRINFNTIWTFPRSYDNPPNCSCATSSTCTSSAAIDGVIVPGFLVGCYPLDSLLQSTLECLYDLNCLEMIKGLDPSMNITIIPLDSRLSSPNVTVQSLIDVLLIDEWKTNVSYSKYYEYCAPVSCTYSVNRRADLLYIVTASIGFYGGLSTAIRIIAPMMAKTSQSMWSFYRTRRMRQNVIVPINY